MSVLVTAMHRSGSSHIATTITRGTLGVYLPGMLSLGTMGDDAHLLPFNELQFVSNRLPGFPFIYHGHFMGSAGNVGVIKAFGIEKVIVVTRGVVDSLRSVCVAHEKGHQMPDVHLPDSFSDMSSDERMNWLAYNFSTWLMAFYVTWKRSGLDALFVHYDEHFRDEQAGNARIAEYLGIPSLPLISEKTFEIAGEKPKVSSTVRTVVENIAHTWGRGTYMQMHEDGIL